MTLVSIPLMDRTGRRTLHLYGLGGMFIFSIFITISFLIKVSHPVTSALSPLDYKLIINQLDKVTEAIDRKNRPNARFLPIIHDNKTCKRVEKALTNSKYDEAQKNSYKYRLLLSRAHTSAKGTF